ncbi:hypothetical protein KI387_035927, partial [Taxus chinensis]
MDFSLGISFNTRPVAMAFGETQFTLIPSFPSSAAFFLVSPITACFEVVYEQAANLPIIPPDTPVNVSCSTARSGGWSVKILVVILIKRGIPRHGIFG